MMYQDTLHTGRNGLGITPEATSVYKQIIEIQEANNVSLSQSDRMHTAIRKLNELSIPQYREANWDGYGALPISEDTIKNCVIIIDALPRHVPVPDIIPEPNGDVGLDWIKGKQELSISVDSNENVSYAFISADGDEMYGAGKLNGRYLPKIFIDTLNAIYS